MGYLREDTKNPCSGNIYVLVGVGTLCKLAFLRVTSARDFSEGGEGVTWGRTFQAEGKATQRPEVGACRKGASSAEIGGAL